MVYLYQFVTFMKNNFFKFVLFIHLNHFFLLKWSKMYIEKNEKFIGFEGFKFGLQINLANDVELWKCVKTKEIMYVIFE